MVDLVLWSVDDVVKVRIVVCMEQDLVQEAAAKPLLELANRRIR